MVYFQVYMCADGDSDCLVNSTTLLYHLLVFAKKALFSRHPVMPDWPKNHGWFFAKLNITNVIVLDFFGGAITVPLEDYFNAKVDPDM